MEAATRTEPTGKGTRRGARVEVRGGVTGNVLRQKKKLEMCCGRKRRSNRADEKKKEGKDWKKCTGKEKKKRR